MGFIEKCSYILKIFGFAMKTYPVRVYRIVKHVLPIRYKLGGEISFPYLVLEWFFSLFLYVTDLCLFPEILCSVFLILKRKVRGLTPKEREIKASLFHGKLKLPILINSSANWMTNKGKYAFVSFYFINSFGEMKESTYAHELIHCFQFSRYGSPYIVRALMAQRTKSGYDYGGIQRLTELYSYQKSQGHLNYEQQGEVLADYFILLNSKNFYSDSKYMHLVTLYEYVVNQWRAKEIYRW